MLSAVKLVTHSETLPIPVQTIDRSDDSHKSSHSSDSTYEISADIEMNSHN